MIFPTEILRKQFLLLDETITFLLGEEYVDVIDNTLTLIKPPDREVFGQFRSSKKAEITSELQCDFRREEGGQEVGSIKKKVSVFIVDTDDTAPFPHDESLAVTIKDKILPNVRSLTLFILRYLLS